MLEEERIFTRMPGGENEPPFPPPFGDGSRPPGRSTSFRWGDRPRNRNPRQIRGRANVLSVPPGPSGPSPELRSGRGKVPATEAKRKAEVRGLVKRHRRHVRAAVGTEFGLYARRGERVLPYADWLRQSVRRTAKPFCHVTDRSRPFPPDALLRSAEGGLVASATQTAPWPTRRNPQSQLLGSVSVGLGGLGRSLRPGRLCEDPRHRRSRWGRGSPNRDRRRQ